MIFSKKKTCFKKGEVIFKENDEGDEMYFVDSGRVKIIKKVGYTDGTLAILDVGDFFGEMSLITGNKRTASAVAFTECKLNSVNKETFDLNLENDTKFMRMIMKTLALRLEETDTNLKRHIQRILRLSQYFHVHG